MFTTKKQFIEKAVSMLKDIEDIEWVRLHVYFKDWKDFEGEYPVKTSPSYPTKKDKIYRLCRQFLHNTTNKVPRENSPDPRNVWYNRDISNIDRFEVYECKNFHVLSEAERKYRAKHGRR